MSIYVHYIQVMYKESNPSFRATRESRVYTKTILKSV